jgi:hypothetical protein
MSSIYPKGLDSFMPALDGFTPIVPEDLNDVASAIRNIQNALGFGQSTAYSAGSGPKGSNTTLKERLDKFLERDGLMKDVAFITGSNEIHAFDENTAGVEVFFGKTIKGHSVGDPNPYGVWFQGFVETEPTSGLYPSYLPGHFWCTSRGPTSCFIHARGLDLTALTAVKSEVVRWACIVAGSDVPGTLITT